MSHSLDTAISAVVLLILSPVLLVVAILIRLEGGGPVLYRQERVGRDGQIFEMLKFRTMIAGSDPVGVGTVVGKDDARVTKVGKWLRRTSLDELPNLVNVIQGDMALVGPRPTISAQVADYTTRQHGRHAVRPGITGWAQVQGRAGIPWDERIELDLEYIERRSLRLDIGILWRTVALTLSGKGLAPD